MSGSDDKIPIPTDGAPEGVEDVPEAGPDFWVNDVGRRIPKFIPGYGLTRPYRGPFGTPPRAPVAAAQIGFNQPGDVKLCSTLRDALEKCGLKDGMTISFHHHLRNGDLVVPLLMSTIKEMGVKGLTVAPSSVHPAHKLTPYMRSGVIRKVETGANGDAGKLCTDGDFDGMVVVRSHGGRVRAIRDGDVKIDIAVIGASESDDQGNCNGLFGPSSFGPLAYAEIDSLYAQKVIIVTDNIVSYPCQRYRIPQYNVDYVVRVDSIGDPDQIASSTLRIVLAEPNLSIAKLCAQLVEHSGYLKRGCSFQAGAGGSSLLSIKFIGDKLRQNGLKASWVNGGTTRYVVDLLHEGLVENITTCQAFDVPSIESMRHDGHKHIEINIDYYANPYNKGCLCHQLDFAVLGATQVDVNFNANVVTHSDGALLHNIGGHQDVAAGAKLAIITCPLHRGNNPIVVDEVTTVSCPGGCVDAIVTNVGIAINPQRKDLLDRLAGSGVPLFTIEELRDMAYRLAGRPYEHPARKERIVGVVEWRDGTVLDVIREVAEPKPAGWNRRADSKIDVERGAAHNTVTVRLLEPPVVPVEAQIALANEILDNSGITDCNLTIWDCASEKWAMAGRIEAALMEKYDHVPTYEIAPNPTPQQTSKRVRLRRSNLYTPGVSPYMMAKASTSGTDGMILDLEDSVAPQDKIAARLIVRNALRSVDFGKTERMVRINQGELGLQDLRSILRHADVHVVVIPKVEWADEVVRVEKAVNEILEEKRSRGIDVGEGVFLLPLIESGLGVENAFSIASSSKQIIAITLGLEDYTADIGVPRSKTDAESMWAISRVLNAAGSNHVPVMDSVYNDTMDLDGLRESCRAAKRLGFVGKRCIHPFHIAVINDEFVPSSKEIDKAKRYVRASLEARGGVIAVGTKMIDAPVVKRAQQMIEHAILAGKLRPNWLELGL